MALKYKINEVKCDIGSYIHYWRGVKKSGKSTLFYDLVQEQYGNLNKGLLIAIGDEIGYEALDGLVYIETQTWGDFIEVVDDLVENKKDNSFEICCLDTVDELVKLAKEEVKRLHKKVKGSLAEFNACFGGYGAPREKVTNLIDEQLARLRRAGYGIVYIGHTKIRNIKAKGAGDDYQMLSSNLDADYDGIFSNKADIVMTIEIERDVDENKHVKDSTRYMYFRGNGYVDAGSRFSEMPERVEYGAKNYIEAFENGVKGAIKGKVTNKDIEKRKKAEVEEREKAAEEYSKAAREDKVDEDRNEEIRKEIKEIASNDDEKKEIFKKCLKDNNMKKLSDEVPTRVLESILEALK